MATMVRDGLPVKYISHQSISTLYWQFQAEWTVLQDMQGAFNDSQKVLGQIPCYDTFRNRYNGFWRKYLRMRKSSQHSQCQTCFDLQAVLHSHTADWSIKLRAARDLRQHQSDQYADRVLYWSLKQSSMGCKDTLVVIIDDMDKSKFVWPRFGFRKPPHEMDNLIRPSLTFTCAIAHGWGTYLFMGNPQVSAGSDYFMEVLSQTLETVYQQSQSEEGRRAGKKLPTHLLVVADNTVKSAKNQFFMRYLAHVTHRQLFQTSTLMQLMVGHTHEDIDAQFAMILSLLKRKASWETPDEVLQYLQESLSSHSGIGSCRLICWMFLNVLECC